MVVSILWIGSTINDNQLVIIPNGPIFQDPVNGAQAQAVAWLTANSTRAYSHVNVADHGSDVFTWLPDSFLDVSGSDNTWEAFVISNLPVDLVVCEIASQSLTGSFQLASDADGISLAAILLMRSLFDAGVHAVMLPTPGHPNFRSGLEPPTAGTWAANIDRIGDLVLGYQRRQPWAAVGPDFRGILEPTATYFEAVTGASGPDNVVPNLAGGALIGSTLGQAIDAIPLSVLQPGPDPTNPRSQASFDNQYQRTPI